MLDASSERRARGGRPIASRLHSVSSFYLALAIAAFFWHGATQDTNDIWRLDPTQSVAYMFATAAIGVSSAVERVSDTAVANSAARGASVRATIAAQDSSQQATQASAPSADRNMAKGATQARRARRWWPGPSCTVASWPGSARSAAA